MTENMTLTKTISPDINDLIQTALVEYLATKRFDISTEIEHVMRAQAVKIAAIEVPIAYKKVIDSRAVKPQISWSGPPHEVYLNEERMLATFDRSNR